MNECWMNIYRAESGQFYGMPLSSLERSACAVSDIDPRTKRPYPFRFRLHVKLKESTVCPRAAANA